MLAIPGNGDCHAAAAGREIEHAKRAARRRALAHEIDQHLRFRPGDQYSGRDFESKAVELALTGEVCNRFSCPPPLQQGSVPLTLRVRQLLLGMSGDIRIAHPQDRAQQYASIQRRYVPEPQHFGDGDCAHGPHEERLWPGKISRPAQAGWVSSASCASCSVWCSAVSAEMSSSSSPSMILSIL